MMGTVASFVTPCQRGAQKRIVAARKENKMTELGQLGVRQSAPPFAQPTPGQSFYREIGAPLVCRRDFKSKHVSVEWLRRRGDGPVPWRYRQDRHAVFYFEHGVRFCSGAVDGEAVRRPLSGPAKLAFVAAGTVAEATFDVPAQCSYLVASFDAAPLLQDDEEFSRLGVPPSQVGFADARLSLATAHLGQELTHTDAVSRLMIESWAAQAWGLLHRRQATPPSDGRRLGATALRRVIGRMNERIAVDVSVAELAGLVGLSSRQFCRRFRASTGSTPAKTFDTMRLDLASTLLATTRRSVTEIALDCGFSQPQHLATAFKRQFGTTPSAFRAAVL